MCLLIVKKWSLSSLFIFTVNLYVTLCLLSLFGKNLCIVVCFKLYFGNCHPRIVVNVPDRAHTSRSSRFNQLDRMLQTIKRSCTRKRIRTLSPSLLLSIRDQTSRPRTKKNAYKVMITSEKQSQGAFMSLYLVLSPPSLLENVNLI